MLKNGLAGAAVALWRSERHLLGDPHNNYYRGTVYYDDITLETWQPK